VKVKGKSYPSSPDDEWSASSKGCITFEEIVRDTHWIGGRVDLRDGLDALRREKFSLLYPGHLDHLVL
jgi:hypothetical protein